MPSLHGNNTVACGKKPAVHCIKCDGLVDLLADGNWNYGIWKIIQWII